MSQIITLTTDFGLQDYYVSAMKAVMLGISPDVRFVDISHEIPPQDIMAGAWVIRNTAFLYPPGTVHLVVVDPGVGTSRNPVALKIKDQYFVGPDNGIFSLFFNEFEYEACKLSNPEFWRKGVSNTFHGRDIFAPVSAHLSNGVSLTEIGEPIDELVTYHWAVPIADKDGLQGWVVHIDRFGNLITNISEELIEKQLEKKNVKIYVGNTMLNKIVSTFGDVEEGEPAAFIGSSGMLEIGINKGNAGRMLSVDKGAQISIVLQK
ncbi:S-adenosyl-l-methionine hydroxide adenosyltransferase family protein [Gracilimonas sp.]|uniref:SAM hydrolase/SAM-dependent halogenase family protein n=1 Tax=Gracilimonas sp. TaxID=1974203 RepID=UPI002870FC6F|nr:SAM-dependent chlorinase/fluorinase [Gracilimonas sp.]